MNAPMVAETSTNRSRSVRHSGGTAGRETRNESDHDGHLRGELILER
jgi:hypothetical protein